MRVLSLFSGVGGIDIGLERAGHEIVGMCEIDKQARRVLRRHWPDVPLMEDVTNVRVCSCMDQPPVGAHYLAERASTIAASAVGTDDRVAPNLSVQCPNCGGIIRGRVDLVAGGSPCQDLSVAGRRAGLDGERSGLFWHQCRIADSVAAPWVLWENVAGAFSSNGGADFAAVLWGITGALPVVPDGGWRNMGICVGPKRTAVWRLLDARWFGVAQRRRRVFVVGGPTDGRWIEVLLEQSSSDRDSRPSATPGQDIAGTIGGGTTGGGPKVDTDRMTFVPVRRLAHGEYANADECASQLIATSAGDPTSSDWIVPVQYATGDITHSLTRSAYKGATEDGTGRDTPVVPVSFGWMNAPCQGDDVVDDGVASLRKSSHPAVLTTRDAVPIQDGRGLDKGQNGSGIGESGDPPYTIDTTGGASVITPNLAVRRLTPVECERLMGWPDDWTRYADDGSEIADSHRYRMCGNGVVSNVTEWIGKRLMDVAQ